MQISEVSGWGLICAGGLFSGVSGEGRNEVHSGPDGGEQIEDPLGGRAASTTQAQGVEAKVFQRTMWAAFGRPEKEGGPLFVDIVLWNAFASTDCA